MRIPMRLARSFTRLLAAACFASVASLAAPWNAARADELQDVSRLVASGKLDDAEKRADSFLAKNPKDAQMRFLKGVILTQRGRRDEAVKVYTDIAQDYPELPEPLNNLAVIYAAQGEYDKARSALEMAIRITPNYANAYENLGDVHAALAAQAYQNARRLDGNNAVALRKLNAARVILSGNSGSAGASVSPAPSAPAAAVTAGSTPRSQRNVGLPAPAGSPAAVAGVGAVAPEVVIPANARSVPSGSNIVGIEKAPTPDAISGTLSIDSSPPSTIAASTADQARPIADVTAAVRRWAASRSVQVDDLKVRVDGDNAVARFRETAARPRRVSNRLLTLKRAAAEWAVVDVSAEP